MTALQMFSHSSLLLFSVDNCITLLSKKQNIILYKILYLDNIYIYKISYTRNLTFPINTAPICFDHETLSVVSRIVEVYVRYFL